MKGTLTQLYWPRSCLNKEGYIIGWSIRGFTCCVICVIKSSFDQLNDSLKKLGEKAEILGIVGKESEQVTAKTKADLWITAESSEDKVSIMELHCCGYKYKANAHIIFFDDVEANTNNLAFLCPDIFHREVLNYSSKVKKSELSTFQIVCQKMNRSRFVQQRLKNEIKTSIQGALRKRSEDSWGSALIYIMKDFGELCYTLYTFKMPIIGRSIQELPFRSQFIQQLISRLLLLRIWESNKRHLKPNYSSPFICRTYNNSYIRVKSALFTIWADFLFGLIFLFLLHLFSTDALVIVHTLGSTIHIEVLKSEVNWLMGLPAGFKPNEALDNAVGSNILILINSWNYVTTYLTRFEGEIVQFFAIFGLFGISFQLALLSDLVDFCTLHM